MKSGLEQSLAYHQHLDCFIEEGRQLLPVSFSSPQATTDTEALDGAEAVLQ